jgi:hypothetical protein
MTTDPDAMIIEAPTMTAGVVMPGIAAEADADAPPEVRQCQDADDPMFGAVAVAVAGTDTADGLWGVMHPHRGGHWGGPADVAEWTVLS